MSGAKGSRNGQSKLTEDDVKLIRLCAEERAALVGRIAELNAKTAAAQRERRALASTALADKFGVSRRVVESIIDRHCMGARRMKTPMTAANVLRALRVGAATADELACDMAGGSRLASAILHNLRKQGQVKARPYTYGGGPKTLLYSLPEHAQ